MTNNLYITAMQPGSGKSVITLGIMELLSRRIRRIGFFRPVIKSGAEPDAHIDLILNTYNLDLDYQDTYAYTHEEAQSMVADGRYDEMMKTVVEKYKRLERRFRFVLCEGTDFTGISSALEFDFNADVANNLSALVLALVNGRRKTPLEVVDGIRVARESHQEKGCTLLAIIANRVETERVEEVRGELRRIGLNRPPVYVLPDEPVLSKPTVGEIAYALEARMLWGRSSGLNREISGLKVAAMNLPHFLDYVADGDLVITPGDRSDVILGSLSTAFAENYPNIAGVLLTGGIIPEPQVMHLIEGAKASPIPLLVVDTDTYTTTVDVSEVRPVITAQNERKVAAALGLFESHVNTEEMEERLNSVRSTRVTPRMFEYQLIERAKSDRRHIVLPEGKDERILRAAEILLRREVVDITLLGKPEEIQLLAGRLGLDLDGTSIVDPATSEWLEDFARTYYDMRKHKGISQRIAHDTMTDVSYFGTMMVFKGRVDGMVSGALHTTAHTIRPSFEIIRTKPGVSIVSSVFFMCLADQVLVYGDCAVNPNPNARELADIAISSAETAHKFGIEPRVAMLSYSTGDSGTGEDVDKVREATRLVQQRRPDLLVEGPLQYDAAVDPQVARTKLPGSRVAGRATVLIFPDLNTGNNTYKAVQRSANAVAIGPVLQGLKKPVNDLSRGCTVTDIVNTVAITAIQAKEPEAQPHS